MSCRQPCFCSNCSRERGDPNNRRGGEVRSDGTLPTHPQAIVYSATVDAVSSVDITLRLIPAPDGEKPVTPTDGFEHIHLNVPGAACAEDVGPTLRAFGSLIGIEGAVRITIEPVLTMCGSALLERTKEER